MKQLPPSVTIPLSLFLGAAVGAIQVTPGVSFLSLPTLEHALSVAVFAGLVAVVHYYQDSVEKVITSAGKVVPSVTVDVSAPLPAAPAVATVVPEVK